MQYILKVVNFGEKVAQCYVCNALEVLSLKEKQAEAIRACVSLQNVFANNIKEKALPHTLPFCL